MKRIEIFRLPNGGEPYREWLESLEISVRDVIDSYIDRMALGGAKKNIRSLKDGIFEIKINKGPGYRVYFGQTGDVIILLLLGGDKHSQFKDVIAAKQYWRAHVQKRRI